MLVLGVFGVERKIQMNKLYICFILWLPGAVSAEIYSSTDFNLSNDPQMKIFSYSSGRDKLDVFWDGRRLVVSDLSSPKGELKKARSHK